MYLTELKHVASVDFPTRWAGFRLSAFEGSYANPGRKREKSTALALTLGRFHDIAPIVRIHSQCITGEVFHSLRCDCHDQLHLALRTTAGAGAGIVVYEQQEGRGIGLVEKIKAYELQDQGLDTIEANRQLGHDVDLRDYRLAVDILRWLSLRSIRLMTNNPDKIAAVKASGIEIVERVSATVAANSCSELYLLTKKAMLGHFWEESAAEGTPLDCLNLPRVRGGTAAENQFENN